MRQIALPLDWPDASAAFLVAPSNAQAAQMLERWQGWPVMTALLVGPPRSGRSLLARLFAARSGGRVIDDAQGVAEAELFHAWNRAEAEHRPLLIVADAAPPAWPIALPDLRSRLAASAHATIGAPDDALVRALFEAMFLRRGLDARPALIDWLAARVERSHRAVEAAVELLATAVTERQRRLSIALAKATLFEAGLLPQADLPEDQ
jgi:hypothetical protein